MLQIFGLYCMGMFVQINTNYQSSGLRIMAYCQCHIVENSTTNDIVCMGGKCRQWTISCKTNTHLDAYRYCCIHSLHMQTQVHMQLVIRGIYNFLKGDSLKRPEWLGISDISKVCKTLAKINGKL